jgi:hypothetical protein
MNGELERASERDIPADKRWEIAALWEVELQRVVRWLEDKASLNFGRTQDVQQALDSGRDLAALVFAFFDQQGEAQDARIRDQASLGALRKQAPSGKLIAVVGVLRWIAMLSEVLLFLFMALRGFGSYVLVVFGVLLALSGYLLGNGLGNLIINVERGEGLASLKGWLSVLIGAIGAGGISYVRAAGVEEAQAAAILVPVIVALTISLLEAMHLTLSFKSDLMLGEMFRAQRWFATDQHRKNYREELWQRTYEGAVRKFASSLSKSQQGYDASGPKRVVGPQP